MSGERLSLDSNILFHTIDVDAGERQKRAREIARRPLSESAPERRFSRMSDNTPARLLETPRQRFCFDRIALDDAEENPLSGTMASIGLMIELPDEIADKVRDRKDRDEFIRHAVDLALAPKPLPPHLEITPGIAGGRPRIAGHRVTVQDIVTWHELQGRTADEIAADFDLSLAEVHAALAYFFDHREEIDAAMREGEAFVETLRRQAPSKLRERLRMM